MMQGVSIPLASADPVAVALNDPGVQTRLGNAARAFLGRQTLALTLTQRIAEAEVIVQEAASRAWKHRDQFDASRDVVKWLVGFVIYVSREYVKKRCRDAPAPPQDKPLEELATDPSRPVAELIADRLLVNHLLEQLASTDRQVVQMKFWDEMTCAEIGRQIGMNENAVRVRLHRAILKLKHACDVTGEGHS